MATFSDGNDFQSALCDLIADSSPETIEYTETDSDGLFDGLGAADFQCPARLYAMIRQGSCHDLP